MNTKILSLMGAALIAVSSMAVQGAEESNWPERQVLFVQPYGPGTALDTATRFLAARLEKEWRQPIVIENKPGANGVIGTQAVARAAPDGYTFLFTGPGHFSNEFLLETIPFDPIKDFDPVARLATVMLVLVTQESSPFSNVEDLISFAKKNPGKLTYSSGGVGSSQHLSAALLASKTGIDVLHVPYKTQSQAMIDIASGEVDFGFVALVTAAAQLDAGKIKALAVSGPRRSRSLPDVPTLQEQGVDDYSFYSFNAVFAPSGTPPEIIKKVSDDLERLAQTQDFQDLLKKQGIESDFLGSKEWSASVEEERLRWKEAAEVGARK